MNKFDSKGSVKICSKCGAEFSWLAYGNSDYPKCHFCSAECEDSFLLEALRIKELKN